MGYSKLKNSAGNRLFPAVGASLTIAVLTAGLMVNTVTAAEFGLQATPAERGQEIAFTRKKGNCLACHHIAGGVSPGNLAPPLVGMKKRYPDKSALKAQIWDPRVKNPDTPMPPFGAHHILSDKQIDDLVEYLYTL